MSIKVDPEFKNLIPPLSPDEYQMLEQSCVDEGIRDALIVWETLEGDDILIDGHNRWEISARHAGIPFEIKKYNFDTREEAIEWIIRNQLGRRNIPSYVRAELILKLKPRIAEQAKEKETERKTTYQKSEKSNLPKHDTTKQLAKLAGVSHDTIHKVEVIAEKAPEETKQALRRGEISINQVYSGIKAEEHETRRKQEERELREAKDRVENYQGQRGKIADFGKAKQNQQDKELIFDGFTDTLRKAYMAILQLSDALNSETTVAAIKAVSKEKVEQVAKDVQDCYRFILKVQNKIAEVDDEK